MLDINQIVKHIDDYLLEKNVPYILLGKANNILFDHGLIDEIQKKNNYLRKILESGRIEHANQTNTKIKQWRIPLSNEKIKINENKNKNELIIKKQITEEENVISNIFNTIICAHCNKPQSFPEIYHDLEFVICPFCGKKTKNHLFKKISVSDNVMTKNINSQISDYQISCPRCKKVQSFPVVYHHLSNVNCPFCNHVFKNPLNKSQVSNVANNTKHNVNNTLDPNVREVIKDDILNNSIKATLLFGLFFPPIWIGSLLLIFGKIFIRK